MTLATWGQLPEHVQETARTRYVVGEIKSVSGVAKSYQVTEASARHASNRDNWKAARSAYRADRLEALAHSTLDVSIRAVAERIELVHKLNAVARAWVERAVHTQRRHDLDMALEAIGSVEKVHRDAVTTMKLHGESISDSVARGNAVTQSDELEGLDAAKLQLDDNKHALELVSAIVRSQSKSWSGGQRDEREAEMRDRGAGVTALRATDDGRTTSMGAPEGDGSGPQNQGPPNG